MQAERYPRARRAPSRDRAKDSLIQAASDEIGLKLSEKSFASPQTFSSFQARAINEIPNGLAFSRSTGTAKAQRSSRFTKLV
jgi:hypothetical protein